jgi:hypothetical protein
VYAVKRIDFFGRSVKIVMQNINGPCPLLAIGNVLSLRNELKLPSGIRQITQVRRRRLLLLLLLLLLPPPAGIPHCCCKQRRQQQWHLAGWAAVFSSFWYIPDSVYAAVAPWQSSLHCWYCTSQSCAACVVLPVMYCLTLYCWCCAAGQ